MNANRQIILYGIGGAAKAYRVLEYYCIYDDEISIRAIQIEAQRLVVKNPSIVHVYAIDNRHGLRKDYRESIRQDSIESHVVFKDILEREGMRIII